MALSLAGLPCHHQREHFFRHLTCLSGSWLFNVQPLPPRRNALNTVKPEAWYSKDMPSHSPRRRPYNRLKSKMWMNGTNSLIDPRYNDGRNRFPLYALTFWKELCRVVDQQESWQKALDCPESRRLISQPLVALHLASGSYFLNMVLWLGKVSDIMYLKNGLCI